MCNLYSMTKTQEAMRNLFKVTRDHAGNLPSLPAIFPDGVAPVIRQSAERELQMMRWGMPGPPQFGGGIITNIRNTKSAHWRRWLRPESRCLVPFSSFCEYQGEKSPKIPTWFALDESRPLIAFAGLWTTWEGTRGTKANPVEGEHLLYGFLTTEPNDVFAPIHPKAMPVILTDPAEWETWLSAPWEEACKLQRPLPDGVLKIVACGVREDGTNPADQS